MVRIVCVFSDSSIIGNLGDFMLLSDLWVGALSWGSRSQVCELHVFILAYFLRDPPFWVVWRGFSSGASEVKDVEASSWEVFFGNIKP